MSLKMIPGSGKSGTSLIRDWICSSSTASPPLALGGRSALALWTRFAGPRALARGGAPGGGVTGGGRGAVARRSRRHDRAASGAGLRGADDGLAPPYLDDRQDRRRDEDRGVRADRRADEHRERE